MWFSAWPSAWQAFLFFFNMNPFPCLLLLLFVLFLLLLDCYYYWRMEHIIMLHQPLPCSLQSCQHHPPPDPGLSSPGPRSILPRTQVHPPPDPGPSSPGPRSILPQTQVLCIYVPLLKCTIPGLPRHVGHHSMWMGGAMQDLSTLGPRLQLDLLRDWPKLVHDRDLWRGVASRC